MELPLAGVLLEKLKAFPLPVLGVSIGDNADKNTWVLEWDGTPTSQQETDAQGVIDALVVATEQTKFDTKQELSASDTDMSRVLEDLIQTLHDNGSIPFSKTDLPQAAQDKISDRETKRATL